MDNLTKDSLMLLVGGLFLGGIAFAYPPASVLAVIAPIVSGVSVFPLIKQIKRNKIDLLFKPQKENEVLVLYHTASGRIKILEGVEIYGQMVKLKGRWGRLVYPRRATYILFGKKVVHAIEGVGHITPPKVVMMANILKEKGYKSLDESIMGELGKDLSGTGADEDLSSSETQSFEVRGGLRDGRLKTEIEKILREGRK